MLDVQARYGVIFVSMTVLQIFNFIFCGKDTIYNVLYRGKKSIMFVKHITCLLKYERLWQILYLIHYAFRKKG